MLYLLQVSRCFEAIVNPLRRSRVSSVRAEDVMEQQYLYPHLQGAVCKGKSLSVNTLKSFSGRQRGIKLCPQGQAVILAFFVAAGFLATEKVLVSCSQHVPWRRPGDRNPLVRVETVIPALAPVKRRVMNRLCFVQTPILLKTCSFSWCLLHIYFLQGELLY